MKSSCALMTVGGVSTGLRGASRGLCVALATNSQGPSGDVAATGFSMAINAEVPSIASQDGAGWLQLAPYGETAYLQKEGNQWKNYRQVFQRDQAARMASAFNAAAATRGDNFRGLPVYIGHPDADPIRWPDDRRVGSVKALEARADGLYVQVAWNDLGLKNREQGYHPFPSPAWMHDGKVARSTGKIVPDELRSVGLVNNPRISDVPAWTNSEPAPDHTDPIMNPIKDKLLKLLGLAETTTDEALVLAFNAAVPDDADFTLAGLRSLATNAETAQADLATAQRTVTTLTTERDQALALVGTRSTVATNALLDGAILAGRLSAAERDGFAREFATNFGEAETRLRDKKPALNTKGLELTRSITGAGLTTERGRRMAYNAKVDELMAKKELTYTAAVEAMSADPEGKLIVESIKEADKITAAKASA